MEKKCISVKTQDFEKTLKKMGDKLKSNKILKKIDELTSAENNIDLLPKNADGSLKSSAAEYFGKRLNVNHEVYSLDVAHGEGLRALALVVEEENVKMYVWFWGGTHNDYDTQIKADRLKKNEGSIKEAKKGKEEYIEEPLQSAKQEMKEVNAKGSNGNYHGHDKVKQNMHDMRTNSDSSHKNKKRY